MLLCGLERLEQKQRITTVNGFAFPPAPCGLTQLFIKLCFRIALQLRRARQRLLSKYTQSDASKCNSKVARSRISWRPYLFIPIHKPSFIATYAVLPCIWQH